MVASKHIRERYIYDKYVWYIVAYSSIEFVDLVCTVYYLKKKQIIYGK